MMEPERRHCFRSSSVGFLLLICLNLLCTVDARYLEEEMKHLKEIMTTFQGELEKYMSSHSQTMMTRVDDMLSRLVQLDKAVRALNERSVLWETTTQNVQSWEDILKKIASRVELIVQNQQALITGDTDHTTPSYLVRRQLIDIIVSRVNNIDSKVSSVIKRMIDDSALSLRRYETKIEKLIRLEGRASLLQDSHQKVLSAIRQMCSSSSPLAFTGIDGTATPPSCDDETVVEKVLVELLELMNRGDSESDGKHETRRSTRRNQPTEELFRKVWRKFQNPVAKINRRLESVEQLLLHANYLCNESFAVNNKVHSAVQRGECVKMSYELQHFTVRTGDQLSQLELKVAKQMAKLGKMLDRAARDGTFGPQHQYPATCEQVHEKGYTTSGVYTIQPTYDDRVEVFCDLQTEGGGWTVIQRRGDYPFNRQNFNRDWEGYRQGFGDPRKEFWIGNDRLHELTYREDNVLRVELEDWENNRTYAEYLVFRVGPEEEKYILEVANYSGNATDSLSVHNGKLFSTYDVINDEAPKCCPCSRAYLGGWWFYACFEAHLNGPYHANPTDNDYFQGIIWENWKGDYSLRTSEMKIRPRHLHYKFTGRGGEPPEDP